MHVKCLLQKGNFYLVFSDLLLCLQFLKNNPPELILVPKRRILDWPVFAPVRWHDGIERPSKASLSSSACICLLVLLCFTLPLRDFQGEI